MLPPTPLEEEHTILSPRAKLLRSTSQATTTTVESFLEEEEIIEPYSFKYETWFFFSKGIPLLLSAVLEWGLPPWVAMAFAGHTKDSSTFQAALGYARVFYNITMLMTMFSMTNYFATVLPGAIGAGRHDRVRRYLHRSLLWVSVFMIPIAVIQLFAANIMSTIGVPPEIAAQVGTYSRLMIPVGYMLMVECHLEQIFINLGYEKCAAANSLITGCGVDICCTYLFIYKWEWGMTGVALAQISVKAARILVWLVFICWFNLSKYFYGCKKKKRKKKRKRGNDSATLDVQNSYNRPLLRASVDNEEENKESEVEEPEEEEDQDQDPLFSWAEFYLFWRTVIPTILTYFTGWLIFELQIICLAHIANISHAALAAGSIWVQTESTLAAIQRGWLQVTRMRTLKLMGKNDPDGAKRSFAALCFLSFLLVGLTNVPLLLYSKNIGIAVSNDVDVRFWLNKIIWVLALHTQTRICSINGGALYIPMEKGKLKVIQNIVSFYCIAAPLAAVAALTNLVTTDVSTKMIFCVAATAVAQLFVAVWSLADMGCRQNWEKACLMIHERANNDRRLEVEQQLRSVVPKFSLFNSPSVDDVLKNTGEVPKSPSLRCRSALASYSS